jgi:putative modified peptide
MASKLTADIVDKLLDKLGSDDTFRSGFSNDPQGSLVSLGAPADVDCGACMRPTSLAPKEVYEQTRAQLRDALLGQSSQKIFTLEGSGPR